ETMNGPAVLLKFAILKRLTGVTVVLVLLGLAGCASVGPDYVRPDTRLSDTCHSAVESGLVPAPPDPQDLARWWTSFEDPALSSLSQRAVDGNLSLQAARARVREARARRG